MTKDNNINIEQEVLEESCEQEEHKCESCSCGAQEEVQDVNALIEENADLKNRVLRSAADMENLRKRHQKELEDTRKYASTSFAKEMLAVQDNMTRAMESLEKVESEDEHLNGTLDGIKIVANQLKTIFEKAGIEKVSSLGEKMNPELHQAMTLVDSEKESNTIVEVFQEGYTMHGRLLRPALVVVAK